MRTEPPEILQGLAGCGAFTPWQVTQALAEPPPEKSFPWQVWQDTRLPPEGPAASFARSPWTAGFAQPGTVPWWHPVVMQVGTPLPTLITEIS